MAITDPPGVRVTLVGDTERPRPGDESEEERLTVPVKPLTLDMVSDTDAEDPRRAG